MPRDGQRAVIMHRLSAASAYEGGMQLRGADDRFVGRRG
jgi:hypothetical protein